MPRFGRGKAAKVEAKPKQKLPKPTAQVDKPLTEEQRRILRVFEGIRRGGKVQTVSGV